MIYKRNNKAMKYVKLFENWMEDEDNDQTSYVDAPVAHADMQVGDEEMSGEDSYEADSEAAAAEETYADGIGYDDSEVEEEEEESEEEEE
jgi:hypothetical protein